ncbi:MAG: hypothetical protein ABJA66_16970 [Actinomycetota bacterium]
MSENVNLENNNQAADAPSATAIIKIEGQEFPLDVKIAADDNLLKTALSPHYPSIKNAQVSKRKVSSFWNLG